MSAAEVREPEAAVVSEPVLSTHGLVCGYGALVVVHGVDINVAPGEFVALLGPNGAGKTSLLATLAGVMKPKAGEVRLFGERTTAPLHRRARKGLAYVGDERFIFPSLTVGQDARLFPGAGRVAEFFPELGKLAGRHQNLLSGGEQQMLGVGRAMARDPKLILVDELSLGLAPQIRTKLLRFLRDAAERGTAVLVVEQSARDVLEHADRAYVMRRGEVVDERPASGWHGRLDELGALYLS